MKPLYRKITRSELSSFSASVEHPPEFDTPWHQHPEFELILIMGSTGTRFMGDNIAELKESEFILIGPNLPHFWKENETNPNPKAEAYVIHFTHDFLGPEFFNTIETKKIQRLLDRSRLGLHFNVSADSYYTKKMKSIFEKKDFEKILTLLELLNKLASYNNNEQLSSAGFASYVTEKKSERINKVFEYSITNFKEPIQLETVAALAHMTRPSFCRFFKKSTGKAYFDFLKEIRIGYACKLLQESNLNVLQICYECGYESISNFNRHFKDIIDATPLQYRLKFVKEAG